jgi:hypothetical protein
MVLLYDYCDISHISYIINMFWEKGKCQELGKKNIFLDFINGKFCKHIIKKDNYVFTVLKKIPKNIIAL